MTEAQRPARPALVGANRRPRQSPTELTLTFTDEATVRQQSKLLEEPRWLLDERLAAFARFAELPIESNRLYTTYVDLRNARLADVRPSSEAPRQAADGGAARSEADIPEGSAGLIELDEHGVTRLALEPAARDAGVVLESLTAFRHRDPEGFRRAAGGGLLPENDKLAQLTLALWSEGAHVHIPDGVRLERPIVLRWSLGRPGSALLSRTLIELGDDAEAKVVEELVPFRPQIVCAEGEEVPQALFTGTSEVRVGAGSSLSFASLQDCSLDQIAFQHRVAEVGRAGTLRWALAQLGGRLVRSRVDNRLVGDGSSVEQVEIVFASSDQLFDLTSYTKHLGRNTTGNLLSKGVLQDSARSFMKGLITIEKSAVGTDSFLGEFGMNLSRGARAVAIPSLEIDQPDCRRAAHSSSVGPIDETQLFYLESRGIPPEEARKFIVLGFLEPVVVRVPLLSAQDTLRELLEAKWDASHAETAAA
jgi:Fe-S cluster assembly scaffold protein SufB